MKCYLMCIWASCPIKMCGMFLGNCTAQGKPSRATRCSLLPTFIWTIETFGQKPTKSRELKKASSLHLLTLTSTKVFDKRPYFVPVS